MASIIDTKASLYSDLRSRSLLDFVGSNDGSFIGAPEWTGNGLRLLGASDAIDYGTTGLTVKTVAILLDPKSTSEDIADLDGGTHTIEVGSGTITATGFATPKIYVDNNLSSTLATNRRQLVTVTTATGFTASAFKVGKETTFLNGTVVAVFTSADELTATEVAALNGELVGTTWPTKPTSLSNAQLKVNPRETGLVGGYNMIPTAGKIVDQSSKGNDGTINGIVRHERTLLGDALVFDGATGFIDVGNTGQTVKSVGFWVKPTTTTEDFMDLDGGTHTIEAASGTVTATGFASPTIYVDGAVGSTIVAGLLQRIFITTATGFTASNLDIGKETIFFEGSMIMPEFFSDEKTAAFVTTDYSKGNKALWKTDWGVNQSVANITSGFLENTPFKRDSGTLKVTMDTINVQDVKVIEAMDNAGFSMPTSVFQQTPTEAAFGKWEWYQNKAETGEIRVGIGTGPLPTTAGNYRIESTTTEVFALVESAVAVLITAGTAITPGVWEKITLTRTNAGVFELFLNDISQGTNTDLSITEATLLSITMKTGDKIAYSAKNGKFSFNKHITT